MTATKTTRVRDAAASRDALLQAAQELFGQNGFEATTIRDIGERAGVDAALIARYFGSKADLYIAAVVAEDDDGQPVEAYDNVSEMADVLIARADRRGPGPIMQAMVRSDTSADIRVAAHDRVAHRLVEPIAAQLVAEGVERPRLRAELAVSALLGVTLARSLSWFDEIGKIPKDELVTLIAETIGAMSTS
ncbi:MAG: Transcriptional regulator, TetR family [Nocardioidaceae bacterium]|nr:Transcriptional regulator, TetR family [Nocardioidaceae bacterium]